MKKIYVCGFLFNNLGNRVCLIKKINKKELTWMDGKLNGLGGKVNENEKPYDAMRREFLEESGVDIAIWTQVCVLSFNTAEIYFYKAFSDLIEDVKSTTNEQVYTYPVAELMAADYNEPALVRNLRWIIPFCLDNEVSGLNVITTK